MLEEYTFGAMESGIAAGTRVWVADKKTPSLALPVHGEGTGSPTFDPHLNTIDVFDLRPVEDLRGRDAVYSVDGSTTAVLSATAAKQNELIITIEPCCDLPAISVTANMLILGRRRPRSLGGNRDWTGSPAGNQPHRRHLRREMSPPERALWQRLKGQALGYKFRRQHSIGPYIADFYCREANLVVEIDGYSHSGVDSYKHDRRRDAFMRSLGLRVLRISASTVGKELDQVVSTIEGECQRPLVSLEDAEWVRADQLCPRDILYVPGPNSQDCPVPFTKNVQKSTLKGGLVPSLWTGRAREGVFKSTRIDSISSQCGVNTMHSLVLERDVACALESAFVRFPPGV
ncbi:MAG: hypothetical protein AMXMBFR82_43340 [Candidatus Hydrogenedentota bacterium]